MTTLTGAKLMEAEQWARETTEGQAAFAAATAGADAQIRAAYYALASGLDAYTAYVEAWRAANGLSTLAERQAAFDARH